MKLIKYNNLVMNEGGINLQRGMNFGIKGSYSIVLMSVAKNSPYADEMLEDGIIKYEGHDQERVPKELKKSLDQPIANKSGTLTQNGKFLQAAEQFKEGKREPAKIKVYRKIRAGVWVDMGFYDLIDGFIEHDGKRNVFKFLLKPNFEDFKPEESDNVDMAHNRYIPGDVMQEVFVRDGGKCVMCGETDNLHFDHKIPYSKGGSSKDAKNIQILCARHNLSKGDKLVY
jgi:hypothetical protein